VSRPAPVRAVVVDLDDTLYPQAAFLAGAAAVVAATAAGLGVDPAVFGPALGAQFAAGSDRPGTIDRALLAAGVPPERAGALVPVLVAAFSGYRPAALAPYPGVPAALSRLRQRFPVALLTDGAPAVQRAKLAATGLAALLDPVVVTDEYGGRAARKPDPAGLRRIAAALGVPTGALVVIGDRPDKDVAAALAVGATAVRVRTGEYADQPDRPGTAAVVADFPAAVQVLLAGRLSAVRGGNDPESRQTESPVPTTVG